MESKTIGRYQLEEFLGEGAFAEVYKATDTMLKRPVALKLLKSSLLADREAFSRFVQEAQAAAGLTHPHIAWAWDLGEADGRCFIAMRFIDGKPLDRIIKEKGALPWDEALRIASEIGDALQAAHDRGLVHRDVKPQNIIISPTEGAVLTDFGLVKAVEATGSLTRTGAMIGTPQYMAPEIWEGKPASPASDQYALACVLVEMLSGHSPFEAPTPVAVMKRVFEGPQFPKNLERNVPTEILEILIKVLSAKPENRYPSIRQFIKVFTESEKSRFQPSNNIAFDIMKPELQPDENYKKANKYYKLGDKLLLAGRYNEAIKQYSEAIRLDPLNVEYLYARGDCFNHVGDYDSAIIDLNLAIEILPIIADLFFCRGISYKAKGNFEQAISDFTRGLKINPKDDSGYWMRGNCFMQLDKKNSQDPYKGLNPVAGFYQNKPYVLAISDFDKSIKLCQKKGEYYWDRGLAYHASGNRTEAEENFRKAKILGYKPEQ